MIRVAKSTRELLRELGRKGDSYDDVIRQILAGKEVAVNEELRGFLGQLMEALNSERKVVVIDVGEKALRGLVKSALAMAYRGERFADWGVSKVAGAKAVVVTFLGIDDEFTQLSVAATEGLKALIDVHGVQKLAPVLDEALEILLAEKAERGEG